ncbi:hypothetical protein ACFYTQ_35340 [Nocardia sp. NPDC004068]|uniref:hypothetical protein n=1 Tax=Nocardia sp. NPDC004068 TaxID=3364303 RepID=UPI0036BCA0AD
MSEVLELVRSAVSQVWAHADGAGFAVGSVTVAASLAGWSLAGRRGDQSAREQRMMLRLTAIAIVFAAVTVQVERAGWITRGDPVVLSWFAGHRSPGWAVVAAGIEQCSGVIIAVPVAIVLAFGFAVAERRRAAVVLLIAVGAATVASRLVSEVVDRPPPAALRWLDVVNPDAYPAQPISCATALIASLTWIYLTSHPSWARATLACAMSSVIIATIAAAGLYVGVHWATDLAAGVLIGAAATTTAVALVRIGAVAADSAVRVRV